MKNKKSTNVHGENWWRGDKIGEGGFGSVYLATRKNNPNSQPEPFPNQIAVKSAKLSVSGSLRKERKILRKLRGCPYVIRCFGDELTTNEEGKTDYNLLLEYASGGSLLERMEKPNKLSESEVKRYTRSILRGIKRVHELGYAHLDIKPDNILLVPISETEFNAKLCDFGMSMRVGKRQNFKYLRGTSMYLSPEAVLENVQEEPSDIWAIGCIVLYMIMGGSVWDRMLDWITEKYIDMLGIEVEVPEIPSEISEEAKEFLKGCFVRKPEDRLSADMLLKLSFVASIEGDDDQEIEGTDSLLVSLSDDDEEDECEYVDEEAKDLVLECVNDEEQVNSIDEEPSTCNFVDEEEEEDPSEYADEEEDPSEDMEEEDKDLVCESANNGKREICVDEDPSVCSFVDDEEEEEDPSYNADGQNYDDKEEDPTEDIDESIHNEQVEINDKEDPSVYNYVEEEDEDLSEDIAGAEYENYVEDEASACEPVNCEKHHENGVEEEPSVCNYIGDEEEYEFYADVEPSLCDYYDVDNHVLHVVVEPLNHDCADEGQLMRLVEMEEPSIDRYVDEDEHACYVEDEPSINNIADNKEYEVCADEEPLGCNYANGDEHVRCVEEEEPSYNNYVEEEEPSYNNYVDNEEVESDKEEDPKYWSSEEDENEVVQDNKRRKVD